jgi:hypothetical protein
MIDTPSQTKSSTNSNNGSHNLKSMNRKQSQVLQDKIKALMIEPKDLLNFYKDEFSEKVLEMCFHIYGNFVIQKFIET